MTLLAGGLNPLLTIFVLLSLVVLIIGLFLRFLKQPAVIIYIITGLIIGPEVLGWIDNSDTIKNMGDMGLILLMFFVGMEINLSKLITNWRVSVLGTSFQVLVSLLIIWGLGAWFGWSTPKIVTLAFVVALSSTTVVVKYLQDNNLLSTRIGQNALGVLLVQDVLVVPMMITVSALSGKDLETQDIILQSIGGIGIILIMIYLAQGKKVVLPFAKALVRDREMQVFMSFAICFGFSLITGLMGLSSALGAFVGGMIVGAARGTDWIRVSLETLRVFFVAIFFISIGLLIRLEFIMEHLAEVGIVVLILFTVNNIINTSIMRVFGENWRESFYTGALLAQAGEFGFMIAAVAYDQNTISDMDYQMVVSIISISLFLSPFWINFTKRITGFSAIMARLDPRNFVPEINRRIRR